MTDILTWIEACWIGEMVRGIAWMFPALETLHFMGLCILMGGLLVVDLRLIGYVKFIPTRAAMAFVPIIIIGFVINLISGIGFFCADPFGYYPNLYFRWKMFLILLAGLNALWYWLGGQHQKVLALAEGADTESSAKIIAWASLVFWTSVIVLGRLIPF